MEFSHKSVLLHEVIDSLNVQPDGIYVDGTLGGAGHAYEVCRRLGPDGRMIGIDQDEDAIAAATKRLSEFGDRVTIVRSNYEAMKEVLHDLGIEKVNGITLDLGVSSYQLDAAERGFSYREDAPLDMRMDNRQEVTAATVVNEYTESELFQVIRKYGEDKFAKNIAKHIVQERRKEPVMTTGRLAQIVDQSIPMKFKKQGGHPAKRTFQAIRIEVNRELSVLEDHISEMIDLLAPGGRFCIIHVPVRRTFRCVSVGKSPKEKCLRENLCFHLRKSLRKTPARKVRSSEYLNIYKPDQPARQILADWGIRSLLNKVDGADYGRRQKMAQNHL